MSPRRPRREPAQPGRLTNLLNQAGLFGTSARGVLMVCLSAAVVTGLIIQVISRTLPVAVAFAAMAGYLPIAVLSGRARNRQRELAEVWPEAVDNLASAVRAGMSLPEALAQLGNRGPEPLRVPLERRVNESGLTIVPLRLYFHDGRAKVEIALARGKKTWDKRQSLAERQAMREVEQAVGRRLKGMTQ